MIGLILAAAGSGSRFGSTVPKQFLPLAGRPLYQASLLRFAGVVSEVVVVVPADWLERVQRELTALELPCPARAVAGGKERQDSVYQGLLQLSPEVEWVLVHDAARPHVSLRLIEAVVETTCRHNACIPVLPVTETVKEVDGDRVVRTLDRNRLRLVQTPQGFQRGLLKTALEKAIREDFVGTDEATLVERLGSPVIVTRGEPGNLKVTWKEDLNGDVNGQLGQDAGGDRL